MATAYQRANNYDQRYGEPQQEEPSTFKAATATSPLSKPINDHLKRVYATLFVGCLLAASACYLGYFRMLPFIFKFHFLNAIATIGLVIGLAASDKGPGTENKRFAMFGGIAFLMGCSLMPLVSMVIDHIDPMLPMMAMAITVLVFGSFSLAALTSPTRREYLYLGGLLFSGLNWLLLLGFVNIFLGWQFLNNVALYGGLAIFCGYVMFDTQMIIAKAENGDRDHIQHALLLFVDAINLFRHILVIMAKQKAQSSSSSNRKNRNR